LPFAVPAFALRGVLGERAELFVDGQRVLPERVAAHDFNFRYATIDAALAQLITRRKDRRAEAPARDG
jgi:NAD dependent epimerase/dehydratase family enzyme